MAKLMPPRIRMPRVTLLGRASKAASERPTEAKPTEPVKAANGADAATKEVKPTEGAKTAEGAKPADGTKPAEGTKPAVGAKTPEPNLQERIEGLQGWMAEIERKQARITYFGGLALLLAIGAAGVALYVGLTTHSEGAKKSDLNSLTNRVNSLQGAVTKNSKDTQNALNASIAQLQQSISGIQKQQAQASANISTIQSQIAAGALNSKNATPGLTPTTPGAAPGSTTTTTTPNTGK